MDCDNEEIMDNLGPFAEAHESEEKKQLKRILTITIVSTTPAVLHQRFKLYKEKKPAWSAEMLQDYPSLKTLAMECWKTENFEELAKKIDDILSLEGFPSEHKRIYPLQTIEAQKDQIKATVEAWKTPYIGQAHILLHSTINQMQRERRDKPYANYLPIVQSSGTGKSRAVHEVAGRVFAIPFNFRPDSEHAGSPFPPSDAAVLNLIESPMESFDDVVDAWVVFFTCLFREISLELQSFDITEDLPIKWRNFLEKFVETKNGNKHIREVLYNRAIDATIEARKKEDFNMKGYAKLRDIKFGQVTATLIQDIRKRTKAPIDPKDVQVLLYFDEAHSIAMRPIVSDIFRRSRYGALCSALTIHSFLMLPVFSIMMSTNLVLHQISPSKPPHSSSRVTALADTLQIPFTELGFDLLEDGKPFYRAGKTTVEELSTAPYMVKFGRPLFMTRYMAAEAHGLSSVTSNIIRFAQAKLLGSEKPADSVVEKLAVLSTRVLLEFEPRRQISRKVEAELVERNLRIIYSIPQHRDFYRSGTPSEPILAEAAAQEMSTWMNTPSVLASAFSQGLIDKGEAGELVSRLILILAYDNAVKKIHPDEPMHQLSFSRGVPLESFLLELIGEDKLTELEHSRATNDAILFKEAFKGAIVRFTHFGKFEDGNPINAETTMAAFARGMAIRCHNTDVLVPILMKNTGLFSELDMTAIFVQINNRLEIKPETVAPSDLGDDRTRFFSALDPRANVKRSYITIAMELGATQQIGCTFRPSHSPQMRNPFPCFAIQINGLTKELYSVTKGNLSSFVQMLFSSTILDEHPRQTVEALSAVRRMKPFWAPGDDFYDWFKPSQPSSTTASRRNKKSRQG